MAQSDYASTLASIQEQRVNAPLAILNLAEPILSSQLQPPPPPQHDHDISNSAQTEPSDYEAHLTPSALAADLAHYQSLFSKLRFSYLEQVTKEKYLRGIVGDPPVLVSHEDNTALEDKLVTMKSDLKAKKEGVAKLVEEMEALAREVARKHEAVDAGVEELERLPPQIADLERQVAEVKAQLKEKEDAMDVDVSDDPRMNLSMEKTEELIEEQKQAMKEVDAQIEALQREMPGKTRECERAERELEELEVKRNEVTRLAREVKRIREEGGRDMLEEQGRWYKSSEIVLNGLLGVQT